MKILYAVVCSYAVYWGGCWELANYVECFKIDTLEGQMTMGETFLQQWELQELKPCTQMELKHKVFS